MAGLGRKVFTAGDVLTASDVQNYLMDQTVMNFAGTAARSSAIATPTEGMFAVTTDNDVLNYYNGSAWVEALPLPIGQWTTYTPTFSGMSLGNGTLDFKYAKLGKIVHVRGGCTFGSTSTMTGPLDISLPFTASFAPLGVSVGQVGMFNGSSVFNGANVFVGNTNSCRSTLYSTSGSYAIAVDIGATIPFTWTTNSQFFISFTYQAA